MEMKRCKSCDEIKFFGEFSKHKRYKDELQYNCKSCSSKGQKEYFHSKEGLITRIYNHQKSSSKKRNHQYPFYTKQNLRDWLFNQNLFHKLFDNWVKSNFNRWVTPSVDRKNDNLPYFLDNIQLTTWRKNKDKSHKDMKSGKLIQISNPQKPVLQYDKQGNFIAEFVSVNQASRETGVAQPNISAVCRNKLKFAGSFKWEFKY